MVLRLVPQTGILRWSVRCFCLIFALVCIIIASAGPKFGVYFEDQQLQGADIFVLLDVSRSMLAEDVPPNRLLRAKTDIRDFVGQVAGDRVGLIAFAGRAVMLAPLTNDRGFLLEVLENVDTDTAPRSGTAIGHAIRHAIRTFPNAINRDRAILLITDGEDHESSPIEAAQEAAALGIKIYTVGIGDPNEGGRIPIANEFGARSYLKYQDKEVWSIVDSKTLREIAATTGGVYIPGQASSFDLGKMYVDHLAGLKHGAYQTEKRRQHYDRFQLFIVLSLIGFWAYIQKPF